MKNKKIILASMLFLLTAPLFSQTIFNTESKDSTNIYCFSLKRYCESLGNSNESPAIVYVEENHVVTRGLPANLIGFEIRYLDQTEIKKHLKGKKSITLVSIVSLSVKGNDFFVTVIPFEVSYKKNNFTYINGGGLKVSFEFDERLKGLKFKAANWGSY